MEFLIPIIPYVAALIGVAVRVFVPYMIKQARDGNMTWDNATALPVLLGGLSAFAGLAAGGLLDAATWQQALGMGLAATISTLGGGEAFHLMFNARKKEEGADGQA